MNPIFKPLMSLDQVATRLGVCRKTVDRYVKGEAFPSMRLPSGIRRVDSRDLEAWLMRNKVGRVDL